MRLAWLRLAVVCLGCGAPQSDGAKYGEALAFAVAAGAAQGAQTAMEESARNAPPRPERCGDDGEYVCYRVATSPSRNDPSEPAMGIGEARIYTLHYINGVRRLNGVGPLDLDESLNAFAQAGSVQLSRDHRLHQHMVDQEQDCGACAENQGSPTGWRSAPLQEQIAEILGDMMREGPGGGHHDNLLRPEARKLGVGIVNPGGRMYFTIDFAM